MVRYDRSRQILAIALAALAGWVDAAGFLKAGGYFVSFMSGNTTRLAVDLASDPARAVMPALLIAGFVVGVAVGAAIGIRAGGRRKVAVLAGVAVLLCVGALLNGGGHGRSALGCLVVAMGALNNTFQRDGEVAVGVTYMTGALVRCGQALGLALSGRRSEGWLAWLLLWLGLAAGALAGSLAYAAWAGLALWIAAAGAALAAVAALRLDPGGAG